MSAKTVLKILDAVTTTGASALQRAGRGFGYAETTLVEVEITGTATVKVQGRLDAAAPWKDIATLTASDLVEFAAMPEYQVNVTARSSGTISAWVV